MEKKKKSKRKSKRKKEKRITKIFLILLIGLIFILLLFALFFLYSVGFIRVINARVEIADKIGLSAGVEELDFGIIMPGGSSKREIYLTNEGEEKLRARIIIIGGIRDIMSVSEKNLVLEKNETKKISFVTYALRGFYGKYSGKVILVFRRAK